MKRKCRHTTQHQIFVNGSWVYWCCACGALKIRKWPSPKRGRWSVPGPALVKRAVEDVKAFTKSEREREEGIWSRRRKTIRSSTG